MSNHIPVLLHETIEALDLHEGQVVVDGTINTAGHALKIAEQIGSDGHIVGIDQDSDALEEARSNLGDCTCQVTLINGNYRNMVQLLSQKGIERVDRILLDIGLSNRQLESSKRGFAFAKDEPLLMTFASSIGDATLTAHEIVNEWEETNLADIIYGNGEERFAKRIAKEIVVARSDEPIETTTQLVSIIERAVPTWYRKKRIHPATKTFQALRITVNDELGALKNGISDAMQLLAPDGRLAIITFHSGEDRIAKHRFKAYENSGEAVVATKKPIVPTADERSSNPKSRSAKLRVIIKK